MKQFDIFFDNDNKLYQVRTKTDTTTIEFTDSEKELIFKDLIRLYDTRDKISFSTIQKLLNKADYNKLLDVVKELQECGIPKQKVPLLFLIYIMKSITNRFQK